MTNSPIKFKIDDGGVIIKTFKTIRQLALLTGAIEDENAENIFNYYNTRNAWAVLNQNNTDYSFDEIMNFIKMTISRDEYTQKLGLDLIYGLPSKHMELQNFIHCYIGDAVDTLKYKIYKELKKSTFAGDLPYKNRNNISLFILDYTYFFRHSEELLPYFVEILEENPIESVNFKYKISVVRK